jgi:ferredoxin--NADP+ reductase
VLTPGPHPFGNPHHLRLYSIASASRGEGSRSQISICVRRCFYIDEVSGERFPGISSNYLCDRKPGESIAIAGPYGSQFKMPEDDSCNLLMIGSGTGIAPFRAFVKDIFDVRGGWKGKIRLFYGARTGMELLYMNDVKDDLTNYYQEETFKAFAALSPRPHLDPQGALADELEHNGDEIWALIQQPNTYVYVAGLRSNADRLDRALARIAGSEPAWRIWKQDLVRRGRWSELLYD